MIKSSIKWRISVVYVIFLILAVSVTGIFVYQKSNNVIMENTLREASGLISSQKQEIDLIISRINRGSEYLESANYIHELLFRGDASQIDKITRIRNLSREYQNAYDITLRESTGIKYDAAMIIDDSISLADIMYAPMEITNINDGIYSNKYLKDKSWYEKILNSDDIVSVFVDYGNNPKLILAQPINILQEQYRNIGVSIISIDLEEFVYILKKNSGYDVVFLDDGGNDLIDKTNDRYININISDKWESTQILREQINNENYIVGQKKIAKDINIVWLISENTAFVELNGLKKIVAFFMVYMIALYIIITFFISSSVTKPILKLAHLVSISTPGDELKESAIRFKNDEVGLLYRSFKDIMHKNKTLMEDVKDTAEKMKKAEIQSMQAQINPHFMYNTLSTVSINALSIGATDIADVLVVLSELFRYNVKNSASLVELDREIETVTSYIKIQQVVYGDGIKLEINQATNTKKCKILKSVLQPLVENSILHGCREDYSVLININCYKSDDILYIEVIDNGVGCDAHLMNEHLNGKDVFADERLGIRNVHQRIKYRFGPQYGVNFIKANEGTKILIKLPAIDDKEDIEADEIFKEEY